MTSMAMIRVIEVPAVMLAAMPRPAAHRPMPMVATPAAGKAVGEPSAERREDRLDDRLDHQDHAGLVGVQPLDVLQVEAEEEGHAEGRGVVEQGRQVGEGKHPVVAQQGDVEDRVGGARFEHQEEDQSAGPAERQQPGPGAVVEVGGADNQQQDGAGVDQAAAPVEGFAPGLGPLAAQLGAGDRKSDHARAARTGRRSSASRRR